tara:strand:- start:121 stop:1101 length:981 start_codon:yes stop_codon:yes gene_type:complete
MKLGSISDNSRDGCPVLVDRGLRYMIPVNNVINNWQLAIENWSEVSPKLEKIYEKLDKGLAEGASAYDRSKLAAPFPRAYQWLDGSAYVTHVELLRKARGVELPANFWLDPLMYQGGSDHFLGPCEPIKIKDINWGVDFEGELAVVVDDVPLGISENKAEQHIKLIMLVNDISLRNLIPDELNKGFGFVHGKPPSAFGPLAITPDTIGQSWKDGKVHLPLLIKLNGKKVGFVNAGVDMTFSFPELVAHAAKTRRLRAGTIIGSGTISNSDQQHGYSCIAEIRMIETINEGAPHTPFLQYGDKITMEMLASDGQSIFGSLEQTVEKC